MTDCTEKGCAIETGKTFRVSKPRHANVPICEKMEPHKEVLALFLLLGEFREVFVVKSKPSENSGTPYGYVESSVGVIM